MNYFKLTVSVCLLPLVSPYLLSLPLALFLLSPLLAPDHLASPGDLFYQANPGYLKPSRKMLQTKVKDKRERERERETLFMSIPRLLYLQGLDFQDHNTKAMISEP